MRVQVLVTIPEVPTSISYKHGLLRLAGLETASLNIGDIPEESLQSIGEEWTRRLLEKAKKMRNEW